MAILFHAIMFHHGSASASWKGEKELQDSMIFYKSFFDAINNVDDKEVQLQVYKAIFEYSLLEQEPDLKGLAYTLFILIKPQLAANLRRREDGKKGGRPKTIGFENETIGFENETIGLENENHRLLNKKTNGLENEKPNVNVNVNGNVNDNAYMRIFEKYNNLQNLIPCKAFTKTRMEKVQTLLETFTEDQIIDVLTKANNIGWLTGDNEKNWKADFDWLTDDVNFCRVQDGRYDGLGTKEEKKNKPSGIQSKSVDDMADELDKLYGLT